MDNNKKCTACNIQLVKDRYWEGRTICRNCYNKTKRKYNKGSEKKFNPARLDKQFNTNRIVIVAPPVSGKTYLMLKTLSKRTDQDFFVITISPLDQYSTFEIKIKKISVEIKRLNDCEKVNKVFPDILGSSNCKYVNQFFKRGRHNNLDI